MANPSDYRGPPSEKVQHIFDGVAHGYDQANTLMTFGMAKRWRERLVRWSAVAPGDAVLDCATGTGDLALAFKKAVGAAGSVTGTDFCREMLAYAPPKAQEAGLDITFEEADVLKLPYADNTFDVVSIAYGVRNVENPVQAIAEMARVGKPGGRVMILETGANHSGIAGKLQWVFTQYAMPWIGCLATGKRWPYEYLRDSSRSFPSREPFIRWMEAAHPFTEVQYRSLFFGCSFLYRGVV